MARRKLFGIMSAAATIAGATAYARYRRETAELRSRLESGSRTIDTSAGPIEYAEAGEGDPLLLIHGAGGGYDQGLMIGRDLVKGFRVIAPSRFGYLRTPVPDDVSPAAQADAHAALLQELGIDTCIVAGVSAGGPSALEFALRHPDRTRALILLVPRTYDPTESLHPDERFDSRLVLRVIESSADFLFWVGMRLARPAIVRFLGVPPAVEVNASEEERQRVTEIMRSIFPLSERVRGIVVDSSIQLSPWPLEQLDVPTLVISAKDDLFGTLPGARFTAGHIRGAELRVLETGGHLMVGQEQQVNAWVADFLKRRLKEPVSKQTAARRLEPA